MRTINHGGYGSWGVLLVGLAGVLSLAGQARGDGVIIIEPIRPHPHPGPIVRPHQPMTMVKQAATVRIHDLAAVTEVDQTFGNPNSYEVEGTYLFPVPAGFNINDFAMTVNGKQVSGELLDADMARRIYEDIVRRKRDPGLLEFVGQRLYRARVYPIPANGKVDVQIKFTGALEPVGGTVMYRYPLKPDKPLGNIERFEFDADIQTTGNLSSVFCPTHEAKIDKAGPKSATVKYSARDLEPSQDLLLYYRLSDEQFGLALLTHRTRGEDGYFMAWISPRRNEKVEAVPKDICFVIDTSGSMAEDGGKKINQARDALDFCLQNLNNQDRFNVISFSTDVRQFADKLVKVSKDQIRDAQEYVQDLKALGGTDINAALAAAMKIRPKDSDRPYMIVFLTDGMPTVGETDTGAILRNVKKAASESVRLFVFGVGYNVNTALLDKLADDNRGSRVYVTPKEDLEVKLSTFYRQIASPVLTDLEIKVSGAKVYDVYPKQLPDLFAGSDLVIVGRYSEPGEARIILSGKQGREEQRFSYGREFPDRSRENDFLPRLWAMRKVGYLLDEIRLNGEKEELKDQVVDLAKRYGIVTPYTSYLVLEDERMLHDASPAGAALRERLERSKDVRSYAFQAGRAAQAPAAAGKAGVDLSRQSLAMKTLTAPQAGGGTWDFYAGQPAQAEAFALRIPATQLPKDQQGRADGVSAIQYAGGRAFYWKDGKWIDSLYDGKKEPKKVPAFSDDYFKLLSAHLDLSSVLALGEKVVFVIDGQAYEITAAPAAQAPTD
jgi:Ca-activated chloride channel family protein